MTPSTEKEPEKIQKICPNCGSTEQHLYVHSKHSHATWSSKVKDKKIFMECPHCRRVLELEEDPSLLHANEAPLSEEEAIEEELAPSTRLRYFSYLGIAFLVLLILWGFMSILQEDRDVKNYLINPQGQVLFIREVAPDQYQIGKIASVNSGVLQVQLKAPIYNNFIDAQEQLQHLKDRYQAEASSPLDSQTDQEADIPVNEINRLNIKRIVKIRD